MDFMKTRMIGLLMYAFVSLLSCGEFNYSPYAVSVDSSNLNEKNLVKLLKSAKASAKSNSFKFIVISDTHDYYDGLNSQIEFINNHHGEYDFVIITGDMTNVGLASEFEEVKRRLKRLKVPYLTTSGNHDLLIDGEKIYKKIFGDDTYSFEYKNTKFILYNNNNWESSSKTPDLAWLEHELLSNSHENLIVLSHVAPNDSDRFTKSEIQYLEELVNRYRVDYYINGHNHNPGESVFGKAKHLTAGASSKEVLLELTVGSFGMSHAFINL